MTALGATHGDVDAACGHLVRAASFELMPVQQVAIEHLAGLVEDASGDPEAARAHMEVVVANARTLAIGAKARAFLGR